MSARERHPEIGRADRAARTEVKLHLAAKATRVGRRLPIRAVRERS
jgi:hypothetical protein